VVPMFGDRTLASIRQLEVRAWVAELSTRRAPATVRLAYGLLAKVMQAAVDAGLIPASPCSSVKLPAIEREEMRFLGPSDVQCLADAIDIRYRALVLVGAYGGLRIGELAGLRRRRVDPLRGRVEVSEIAVEVRGRIHVGAPKTRAGRRTVALPRTIVRELEEHLARWAAPELVFPAPEGGPLRTPSWRRRFWQPAVRAAGLEPLRPHDLRHTAVALWIAAGANVKEVATRAGHTSVAFTLDRYGHLYDDADEALRDRLDAMLALSTPEASVVSIAPAASARPDSH